MKIIKGGKPSPVEPEDTFLADLLLTHTELDDRLIRGEITRDQYAKLIEEVPI